MPAAAVGELRSQRPSSIYRITDRAKSIAFRREQPRIPKHQGMLEAFWEASLWRRGMLMFELDCLFLSSSDEDVL